MNYFRVNDSIGVEITGHDKRIFFSSIILLIIGFASLFFGLYLDIFSTDSITIAVPALYLTLPLSGLFGTYKRNRLSLNIYQLGIIILILLNFVVFSIFSFMAPMIYILKKKKEKYVAETSILILISIGLITWYMIYTSLQISKSKNH